MGGSPKTPQVSQIPLMNPQQKQFLGQLLNFVPQAMGGFQLGQPYGGPSESSYSPFTIPGGEGMPTGGKGGGMTGQFGEMKDRAIEDIRADKDQSGGGRGRDDREYGRERAKINRIPEPVLDAILNSEELPSRTNIPEMRIPESQPISPIEQTLTQPIISPFTRGMTGNFPKREARRR